MSRSHKRKYRVARTNFKRDLLKAVENNRAFAMLIIQTHRANQHRRHITKIWELLGFNHPEAYKDYCKQIGGQHLCGSEDIWKSIYFADKEIHDKYRLSIPEMYAMGDALGIAYRVLRN
ncbi:hypothetical protein [Bacillus thuringiensis]|uniref:Uncharacterized protein n=1 Tax=Bacillus thuringiensis TaxID=1428 RepID=A0A9X6WJ05_BACTU|nr:hypothetical protein [Bacillus thuringiensis]PFJ33174.1 hypothetical protein COJ15_28440 [Bacillus thuringiensis]